MEGRRSIGQLSPRNRSLITYLSEKITKLCRFEREKTNIILVIQMLLPLIMPIATALYSEKELRKFVKKLND